MMTEEAGGAGGRFARRRLPRERGTEETSMNHHRGRRGGRERGAGWQDGETVGRGSPRGRGGGAALAGDPLKPRQRPRRFAPALDRRHEVC